MGAALVIKKYNYRDATNEAHSYCFNPDTGFTYNRKLSMEKMLQGIIGMKRECLTNGLSDLFHASAQKPAASAFIQQRSKINHIAFETIFKNFSWKLMDLSGNDIPVCAVDGPDVQIHANLVGT